MTEEESPSKAIQLQHSWVLYYDEQPAQQKGQQSNDYSDRLKPLGTFSTVQVRDIVECRSVSGLAVIASAAFRFACGLAVALQIFYHC